MTLTMGQIRLCMLLLFGALALATLASVPAHAQFQYHYGGTGTENFKWTVLQTFDGGFISTGESNSGRADYDVYVVKTTSTGAISWAFKYNIGGDDHGRGIQQLSDSGFIVTGYTANTSNCCTRNDIFLMRLNKTGAVQWVQTYGGLGEEEGWHVQVLTNGDYVVAGRTNSFGQGDLDAILLRTNSSGTLLWGRVYGGTAMDYFTMSTTSSSDIVACGVTASYSGSSGDLDALLMRINASTGVPIWTNHYGVVDTQDWFRTVRTCSNGDLIAVGNTRSFGGNSEAWMIRTNSNGATLNTMIVGGQSSGGWDEFSDVRELSTGDFIVTGLFFNVPNGFGDYDVYVGEYTSTLNLVWNRVYGGTGLDWGNGINVASGTASIIVSGETQSFGNGDQGYLIRTTPAASSSECNAIPDIDSLHDAVDSIPMTLANSGIRVQCSASATRSVDSNAFPECTQAAPFRAPEHQLIPPMLSTTLDTFSVGARTRLTQRELLSGGDASGRGESEKGGSLAAKSAGVVTFDAIGSVYTYPNPVAAGSTLFVESSLNVSSPAEIVVSDLEGKVLRRISTSMDAGTHRLPIGTDGWAPGVYVVKMTFGQKSRAIRIVVEQP